ncbi:MAG: hypothetical protein V2I43_16225 [Parvularcula sp.]|jgi:hypothetical protein|nr:hypothetical protein [Parvularcula sp.]
MILLGVALLILFWGVLIRGRGISAALRRRLLVIAGLTLLGMVAAQLLRLPPFGFLVLLIGLGVAANTLIRGRSEEDEAQPSGTPPPRRPGAMSREEAMAVLGLKDEAHASAVEAAHRRMILRAHPDQGGSDYLAAKVNEARDVLLRE